jgi:putative SOS response-associated peptidase YedK
MRRLFGYSEQPNFPPRYNVAPTQPIPVVRLVERRRSFALLRWGLVPSWVKDPRAFSLLINARGETVREKPAFRNGMRRRRCLLPADGYYEWKREENRKQPFYIHAPAGPVAFAGLWETWMGPNGEEMETACIITTAANRALAHIHDRMPAVIPPEAFDTWLDCSDDDGIAAAALLKPAPDDLFEFHEVSTAVNRAANDGPELIARVAPGRAPPAKPAAKARPKPAPKRKTGTDDGQSSLF